MLSFVLLREINHKNSIYLHAPFIRFHVHVFLLYQFLIILICKVYTIIIFRIQICSRMWDACLVVDGGSSFKFNDGAIATLEIKEEDALKTVVFD